MTPPTGDVEQDRFAALVEQGLHEQALKVAEGAPGRLDADVLYDTARSAAAGGHLIAALAWLDKARCAYLAEGSPLSSLRTELGRVNVLDDLARTSESIAVAQGLQQGLESIDLLALTSEEQGLHAWLKAAAAENLGATLGLSGRHGQAVASHRAARALYGLAGSKADVARANANLGVDLIHTGDPKGGLAALEAARPVLRAESAHALADRCLMYEARALAMMGEYGSALDRLSRVESTMLGSDGSSARLDALRVELSRAGVFQALNLFPEALDVCSTLAPEFQRLGMIRDLASCRHIEACIVLELGQTDAALDLARECVELFESVDLPACAADARVTVARCLGSELGLAEIDLALEVFIQAGENRSIADAALAGAELASASEDRLRYLDEAVRAAALESPETRWRTLWNQSVMIADSAARADMLDEALATLGEIHNNLTSDRQRAPFMANRRDPLEARVAVHLVEGEHEKAYLLSATYRAMALRVSASNSKAESAPVVTATNETTVLYQSIGDQLVCFVSQPQSIGPNHVAVIDLGEVLPEVAELMLQLDAEWRHLADPRLRIHIDALRGTTERILQRLHLAVFAAVEEQLNPGPIIIVPTGCLSGLPFAALHDGSTYLIDRRAVAIAPGVAGSPAPQPSGNRTVVVGLPDQLAPLIRTEATQIAHITGGRLLLGQAGHADAVKDAIADADTIHLATHSVFRSDNPWLSWMRLADREVTAAELATWDLEGRMVIFAACASGRQSGPAEDEMLGLPRAAILAGANAVIVNLWAVDDVASVGLMSQLHSRLSRLSPALALQEAQLACRALHPHPYFWGGSMLYMNPRPKL